MAHGLRGFSSWSLNLIALGVWQYSMSRKKHLVEEVYSLHGSQEAKRERERGWGSQYPPSRAHPQGVALEQPPQ